MPFYVNNNQNLLLVFVVVFLLCVVRVFYTKELEPKEITNLCDSQVIKCRYIEQINKKKTAHM